MGNGFQLCCFKIRLSIQYTHLSTSVNQMYQKNSNGIVTLAVPGAILKEECFDPLKSKIGGNPVNF